MKKINRRVKPIKLDLKDLKFWILIFLTVINNQSPRKRLIRFLRATRFTLNFSKMHHNMIT